MRITREQRPHFEPQGLTAAREKAHYSDTGFQLLMRILETVTDRSFVDLLTERISVRSALRTLGSQDIAHQTRRPQRPRRSTRNSAAWS